MESQHLPRAPGVSGTEVYFTQPLRYYHFHRMHKKVEAFCEWGPKNVRLGVLGGAIDSWGPFGAWPPLSPAADLK